MTESDAWWLDFYDDDVAEHLLARGDGGSLASTVDFLWDRLRLGPGSQAFDQCCGVGNVALELARRGAAAVGVDASSKYVAAARDAARTSSLPARFHCGDAREFVAPTPCDAAFNWWTGFGGAGSRREDLRMLERVRDSLRGGGLFLLEVPHAARVWRSFQSGIVRRFPSTKGESLLVRECELHPAEGTMTQVWTWLRPDGTRRVHRSRLRLYTPPELGDMLSEAGLALLDVFGDLAGGPLQLDSERCILRAVRTGGG